MTVTATVFEGTIADRRDIVVMKPHAEPIMVPMDSGFKQISVLYIILTENGVQHIYYPDWDDAAAVESSIFWVVTSEPNLTYTILPVSEITKTR